SLALPSDHPASTSTMSLILIRSTRPAATRTISPLLQVGIGRSGFRTLAPITPCPYHHGALARMSQSRNGTAPVRSCHVRLDLTRSLSTSSRTLSAHGLGDASKDASKADLGSIPHLLASEEYSRPFSDLSKNLHPTTIEAIQSAFGYESMSKVQFSVLSTIPTSRNLVVKAKTGTGKTLAFLVATLETLRTSYLGQTGIQQPIGNVGCVIVAPTRELALQISDEATRLLTPLGWGIQYLVGGESKGRQLDRFFKEPAQFIVATPGRMKDMLGNAEFAARISQAKVLILDEADTMLELGFRSELDAILGSMPKDRQTFLFSATVDAKIDSLVDTAFQNSQQPPIMIDTVGSDNVNLNLATRQRYCIAPCESHVALVRRIINDYLLKDMDEQHKEILKGIKKGSIGAGTQKAPLKRSLQKLPTITDDLVTQANQDCKIMVFLPTTRGAQLYAKIFSTISMGRELSVFEIHSAKSQRERTLTSRNFRNIKTPAVLFTSDISARGVDYPGVDLVVQVGAPTSVNQYIHRIGRTGRGDISKKKKKALPKTKDKDQETVDHGRGILILGELDKGFIEHQLSQSSLSAVVRQEHKYDDWQSVVLGESLDSGFRKALTKVDEKLAKSAYTAFLGYNLTIGPRIGSTDRAKILETADKYIQSFGVQGRPAVSTSFLERMGFMRSQDENTEDGQLVDGTYSRRPTRDSIVDMDTEETIPVESRLSRKERQEAFAQEVGLSDTEYVKVNEEDWEDFMELKTDKVPKLIERLHSPKRLGHFGNRPSKKFSKIFSNNDGW
ncbi:hypothetical protein BGW38_005009, partial [Lunasporangiospora selenospora]